MTDKPEHSPLPWRVSPHDGTYLLDANGREVCETGSYTTEPDVMKADARLIVTAVNSHAALVAVVEAFIAETVDYATLNNLGDPERQHNVKWGRAVLAAAKGEKE